MNFKSKNAYNKWLAYGHASGEFAKTPGHQPVSIKGKKKKVKHDYGGPLNIPNLESVMLSNKGLIKDKPVFSSLTKERRENNIIDLKLNYPTQGFRKDPKFYKFMFAHPAGEGVFGMAGLGHPKTGLEANVGGFAPYNAIKNPYFKGDYFARIKKNFPKFSIGASTNIPISGYPNEAGKFTMNKPKPAFSLNFGMNLREGGDMVSTMGYRDDSPFRNSKSLNIYSPDGWIDMTNVSQPIKANGVILEPNSGLNQVPPDENGVVKEERLIKKFGGNIHQTDPNMSTPGFYNRPILPVFQEGTPGVHFKRVPFSSDIGYQQLGPKKASWFRQGPYADSELKSQEQFIRDEFNRAGEVAKPYTVEFKEAVVYPTDELKRKQEKLLKNYESNFQKLWNYNAHADVGVPKSNRIQDLEDWNKKATKTIKENDKLSNRIKEDVGKLQKQLGYENPQDVLSAQGLADFRNLYKEGKISYSNFMDNYNNYLKFYDPNLVTLSAEEQKQLENIWKGPIDEQGRRTWMSDPMNVTKVAKEVAYSAPLTGAGFALAPLRLPGVGTKVYNTGVRWGDKINKALQYPLQIGNKTIPGATMGNLLDAYGIASMPFLANESYNAFSEGDWQTGLTKAGEAAFMGLGFRNPLAKEGVELLKTEAPKYTKEIATGLKDFGRDLTFYHSPKYRKLLKDVEKQYNNYFNNLIKTEEGKNRLRNIGIDPSQIKKPELTFIKEGSYYRPSTNTINFDPFQKRDIAKSALFSGKNIFEHELGHWMQAQAWQQSPTYKKQLNAYESAFNRYYDLQKAIDPEITKPFAERLYHAQIGFDSPFYNAEQLKKLYPQKPHMTNATWMDEQLLAIHPKREAVFEKGLPEKRFDYFNYIHPDRPGKISVEPFAHGREMRQSMVDQGIISSPYDPISKEQIMTFMVNNPKDRITSFTFPDEKNLNILHTFMNRAPITIPAIGVAGLGLMGTQDENK